MIGSLPAKDMKTIQEADFLIYNGAGMGSTGSRTTMGLVLAQNTAVETSKDVKLLELERR